MITIIIPVYNEEKIIVKNTKKLFKFLDKLKHPYEVIICSNGSTDSTVEKGKILENEFSQVKFLSIKEKGVGFAFKKSVSSASYNNIISIDMDLPIDLDFIPKCLELLRKYDIVVGSKIVGSQKRSFLRRFTSHVFIFLAKVFLGLDFSDYSPGAKGYKKDKIINRISNLDEGSFYVTELLYFGKIKNLNMIQIPVFCEDVRESKFSILHESLYRLKSLLGLWLFGV